jgi:hypothetical protein
MIRVRGEMMGSPKGGIAGKSQSVLVTIDPMFFTRTRVHRAQEALALSKGEVRAAVAWLHEHGLARWGR